DLDEVDQRAAERAEALQAVIVVLARSGCEVVAQTGTSLEGLVRIARRELGTDADRSVAELAWFEDPHAGPDETDALTFELEAALDLGRRDVVVPLAAELGRASQRSDADLLVAVESEGRGHGGRGTAPSIRAASD